MSYDYFEKEQVENYALKILEQELGWKICKASEVSRRNGSEKSPLLIDDLFSSLKRLNPWINDSQINKVINKLEEGNFNKFSLSHNRNKYFLIRDGVSVTLEKEGGKTEWRKAIIIDFSNPENNQFTAVSQLRIKAQDTGNLCIPDLLGFVNGLPLLFMEFKSPNVDDLQQAYNDNYLKYLEKIPQLFSYNAFCVFSNRKESKLGTVNTNSKYDYFKDWPRLTEESSRDTTIENLLRGVCRKDNFLDLFENFILFSKSKNIKIVARNHQFLGVNLAFESYRRRRENKGKLGTFWHTQGSGKSYSMIFFAEKIKRKFGGSPVFIILTDRKELSQQIYDTFSNCGVLGDDSNCKVENKKDLEKKLKEKHSYVFSLIHKFANSDLTPIQSDKEIIIIADEAHRTQYGDMADAMYRFLPKASRIGFTGTPLLNEEQITARYFGDYVSQYDFLRAIEDKVTVPLIYINRASKIKNIDSPEINTQVSALLDQNDLTLEKKNRLKKKLTRDNYSLMMAEDRLKKNAQDFVNYYSSRLHLGKALYVCLDRKTCYLMQKYVREYWDKEKQNLIDSFPQKKEPERRDIEKRIEIMSKTEMEVVVSDDPKKTDRDKAKIEEKFKKKDDNLRIVFVCEMWLTGFDVPCLSFLFLDRSLKEHTLMQAIARPNRRDDGKQYGVIVDYMNCLAELTDSLNKWSAKHKRTALITKSQEEVIQKVIELIDEIEKFLKEQGIFLSKFINEKNLEIRNNLLIDSKEALLLENIKDKFNKYYQQLDNDFRYIIREDLEQIYRDKFTVIKDIHESLRSKKVKFNKDDLIVELFSIIQKHVKSEINKENFFKEISNSEIDSISNIVIGLNRKRNIVNDIVENFESEFEKIVDLNPSSPHVHNLFNAYNKLIEKWNKSIEPKEQNRLFSEILENLKKLEKQRCSFKEEGFSMIQSLAIYEICKTKTSIFEEMLPKLKIFSENFFLEMRDHILNTQGLFEKESTKSELLSLIKTNIFSNYPFSLSDEELYSLRDALFGYLFNLYRKNLF